MEAAIARDTTSQEEVCVMIITVEIRNNSSSGDFVDRVELELKAENGKRLGKGQPPPIETPPGTASVRIGDEYHPVFPWSERLPWPLFIPEKPGKVRGKVAFSVSLREFPEFNLFSFYERRCSYRVNVFGRNNRVWSSAWYGNATWTR